MTVAAAPLWTQDLTAPICRIPWLGRFVVLSAGHANFCCYSSAVVGNVNEASLEEIWRGPAMRHIRSELAQQRLPKECQSTSCPVYRGDSLNHVSGTSATVRANDWPVGLTGGFAGLPDTVAAGTSIEVEWWFAGEGAGQIWADLFVAVQAPDGAFAFLPEQAPYALPFQAGVTVSAAKGRWTRAITVPVGATPGLYRLSAAVVEANGDPNDRAKCYWTTAQAFVVA